MELTGVYKGTYVSAPSASTKLDIEEIFAACDLIDGVANSISSYATSFNTQSSKLDMNALSINGTSVGDDASTYYNYLIGMYNGIKSSTQSIREAAVTQYNAIQDGLNEEARNQDLAAGNS